MKRRSVLKTVGVLSTAGVAAGAFASTASASANVGNLSVSGDSVTTDDGTITDVTIDVTGDWKFDGFDTVPDFVEVELQVGKSGNWETIGTSGRIGQNTDLGNAHAGTFQVSGSVVNNSSLYALSDFTAGSDGNSANTEVHTRVVLTLHTQNGAYNLTGLSGEGATATSSSAGWIKDRHDPSVSPSYTQTLSVDTSNEQFELGVDGDGPTSGFYDQQGFKYVETDSDSDWHIGDNARHTGSLYIDGAWESDTDNHRIGFWFTTGTSGSPNDYNVVEYVDTSTAQQMNSEGLTEATSATLLYWDRASVGDDDQFGDQYDIEFVDIGLPSGFNPNNGGWLDLEFVFHPGYGIADRLFANGELLKRDPYPSVTDPFTRQPKATHFMNTIVQSVNYGQDQTYIFDNFALYGANELSPTAMQSTTLSIGVTNEGATVAVGGSGSSSATGTNESP